MKKLLLLLILASSLSHAEIRSDEMRTTATLYYSGKYEDALSELKRIKDRLERREDSFRQEIAFISYWEGLAFKRIGELEKAQESFKKSLEAQYAPLDLNYEYGQTLYALNKYEEARLQFRESLKRKYKRGISLYYIGLISKEMGETKKALTFLNSILKIEDEDFKEVKQASEMLIAEMYLDQSENRPENVSKYVIPQYKKALKENPESELASDIQNKILELEYKYDLELFKMRNGRAISEKPYVLRFRQEIGNDSNVFYTASQILPKNKKESAYTRTDLYGRYTFYHKDALTITPELRLNGTYYFRRKKEIYRNDNLFFSPGISSVYEHTIFNRAGGLILEYRYDEAQRDIYSSKKYDLSYRAHHFVLGERLNIFQTGETLFKVGHQVGWSYKAEYDLKENFISLEQSFELSKNSLNVLLDYRSYRFGDSIYNADAITLAGSFFMWDREDFSPGLTLGVTRTDPIKDRLRRGQEMMWFSNLKVVKAFDKNWSTVLKLEMEENKSKATKEYSYSKLNYSLGIDYLF